MAINHGYTKLKGLSKGTHTMKISSRAFSSSTISGLAETRVVQRHLGFDVQMRPGIVGRHNFTDWHVLSWGDFDYPCTAGYHT